jgi:hypothetical protein
MKTQFAACKNYKLLNTLSSRSTPMTLDYWYMYYHIRSKNYTYYTLLNKINRFTEACNLCIYGLNHSTNEPFHYIIPLNMNELTIQTIGNTVSVKRQNLFAFTINFQNNDMTYDLTHSLMNVHLILKATDWNTNQATFFPRYAPIRYLMNLDGAVTDKKGEWVVDSPCMGDLVKGVINGERVGAGTMWFDTYSGTNYHYLGHYIWFYVHTAKWIIYILEFQPSKSTAILIKNVQQDRWFYSGINVAVTKFTESVDSTVHIDGAFGSDFTVTFTSSDINIRIASKRGTIKHLFNYLYYDNPNIDESTLSSSDLKYYRHIKEFNFDEYLCQGDVTVEYDGSTESFESRVIYESMHKI